MVEAETSDWRDAALEDFRRWLDRLPGDSPPEDGTGSEECDLHTLFAELAALRQEVRLQSREQGRSARDLDKARERYDAGIEAAQRQMADLSLFEERILKATERRCLLPFLEVRDALLRGRDAATRLAAPRGLWRRVPSGMAEVVDGYGMAVERFDRALDLVGVEVLHPLGERFDADTMHAVHTRRVSGVADQEVVEELRCGFLRSGVVLRFAEVVVNRLGGAEETKEESE